MTGGLGNFFKKIIPITMLLCLVAFGLSIIIPEKNFTYLTETEINGVTFWKFDFVNYVKNINFNYIKSAITNVIDIDTFTNIVNQFTKIWNDGYNFGDITKTIITALVLLIDVFLTGFNILICPLRIIGGLMLTAFNIVGINTNSSNFLVKFLKSLVNLYRTGKNGQMLPLIPIIPLNW